MARGRPSPENCEYSLVVGRKKRQECEQKSRSEVCKKILDSFMKADDRCKMLCTSHLTLLHRGRDGGVVGRDDEPFRAVDDPPLLPLEVRCWVEALQGDRDQHSCYYHFRHLRLYSTLTITMSMANITATATHGNNTHDKRRAITTITTATTSLSSSQRFPNRRDHFVRNPWGKEHVEKKRLVHTRACVPACLV